MSFVKELRNFFFDSGRPLNSRGKRINFNSTGEPDQDLMERFASSVPFFKEASDRAKQSTGAEADEDLVGLVQIHTDVEAKANTSGLSAGTAKVVHGAQLPTTTATESQAIAGSTAFSDIAMEVTTDGAVTTRNNFLIRLRETFRAWLETLRGDVDTNTTDIATNLASINANTADIADIRTTTGTSDGDTNMGSYTGGVLTAGQNTKTNIQELETQMDVNTGNISTNTGNISTNTTNIGTNTGNIATNTGNISTNAGNITTNTNEITSLRLLTGSTTGENNLGALGDPAGIMTDSQDLKTNLKELSAAIAVSAGTLTTGSTAFNVYRRVGGGAKSALSSTTTTIKWVKNGKHTTLYFNVFISDADFVALAADSHITIDLATGAGQAFSIDTLFGAVHGTAVAETSNTATNVDNPYSKPVAVELDQGSGSVTDLELYPMEQGATGDFNSLSDRYVDSIADGTAGKERQFTIRGQISYMIE
jgi:hypothetical protein